MAHIPQGRPVLVKIGGSMMDDEAALSEVSGRVSELAAAPDAACVAVPAPGVEQPRRG
jgi:hypothetical protein